MHFFPCLAQSTLLTLQECSGLLSFQAGHGLTSRRHWGTRPCFSFCWFCLFLSPSTSLDSEPHWLQVSQPPFRLDYLKRSYFIGSGAQEEGQQTLYLKIRSQRDSESFPGAIPSGVTAAGGCLLFRVQKRQERALETEAYRPSTVFYWV